MYNGRNFRTRQDIEPHHRLGRYVTNGTPLLVGAPAVIDSGYGLTENGKDGNGRRYLKRADSAVAPVAAQAGIALYEFARTYGHGFDPVTHRPADQDTIPAEEPTMLVHGPGFRFALINTTNRRVGGLGAFRDYPGRLMVANLAAFSESGGEFITPAGSATDEVQALARTSTGGTFTLTFTVVNPDTGEEEDHTTAAIAATAAGFTAAAVQAALRALPVISATGVTVTGSAGGPLNVTFGGEHEGRDVSELVVDDALATGGDVTISTSTPGAGGDPDVNGYWAKTTDRSLAWAVTTEVDIEAGLLEAQLLF